MQIASQKQLPHPLLYLHAQSANRTVAHFILYKLDRVMKVKPFLLHVWIVARGGRRILRQFHTGKPTNRAIFANPLISNIRNHHLVMDAE
jgi:hypothetical protein